MRDFRRRPRQVLLLTMIIMAGCQVGPNSDHPNGTETVAAPKFNPPAGTYSTPQNVTISTTTSGATIRYTMDGSAPASDHGTVYAGPVDVSGSMTLRAIAYQAGWNDSAIASADYTITGTVAAPAFDPPGGTYPAPQNVIIATTTSGATIRYTIDGSAPASDHGTVYAGPVDVPGSMTLRAIAYQAGWNDSAIVSADYTITGTVAAPAFDPPGGTYSAPQNVSMSTTTGGATILYTTDGSLPDPDHGTVYSAPVHVSASMVLSAVAYLADWADSPLVTAEYTITGTNRILLSANSVSDDDPNNALIGEFSLAEAPPTAVSYALTDDADDRFKLSENRLFLNDYTRIDSAAQSIHAIAVEATFNSSILSGSFDIHVTETNDLEIQPTPNLNPILGRPAIASDGTDFLVAWIENSAVRCARVSSEGRVLDAGGITIGQTSGYPGYPSVAFGGTNYFIVWANYELYGVRIDLNGTVLDADPRRITLGANAKLRAPSVVFDGQNYFAAWRTNNDQIKVARIGLDATIIDSQAGIVIGTGFYPWVAFDGMNYLVVWHGWGSNGLDIFGNRVSAATASVLDGSGFAICDALEDQDHSSVAFDGTQYLVVWHDSRGGIGYSDGSVYGARVSTGGQVIDSPPFLIYDLCRGQVPVLTVPDGEGFFVVWQTDLTHIEDTARTDLFARKIAGWGELVGDVMTITAAHGFQFGPVMGQSSSQYLIAWSEGDLGRGVGVWARLVAKQ